MKKSNRLISILLTLVMALALMPVFQSTAHAAAGDYYPGDIAVINNIISNNGLGWTAASPADGSYVPVDWAGVTWSSDTTGKRIRELNISNKSLYGVPDVSGLSALRVLTCDNNTSLTSINVSGLMALEFLYCSDNSLTSINVSGLSALQCLYCRNNSLTSLNVNGLSAMKWLECNGNNLTSLALDSSATYTTIWAANNYLVKTAVTGQTITWDGTNFIFDPQKSMPTYSAGDHQRK